MFKLLTQLEKAIYLLRDFLWDWDKNVSRLSQVIYQVASVVYKSYTPYSHYIVSVVLILVILLGSWSRVTANANTTYIEAVVTGVDSNGKVLNLAKINPIITSNIQLEKDVVELIYEPLVRYDADSTVTKVLAQEIVAIQEGAAYEITINPSALWHDGVKFKVEDVFATLQLIKDLDEQKPVFAANSIVKAVKQMNWERTGPDSFIVCTTSEAIISSLLDPLRPCSTIANNITRPIIANFIELLSFKIMPAHLIKDLNSVSIQTADPTINRFPIGTGPYKFSNANDNYINLNRFDLYYSALPSISRIRFKTFATIEKAINALTNGEVHAFATSSTEGYTNALRYKNVTPKLSAVQNNQYWAVYFNQRRDPSGNAIGSQFLLDPLVRRAISFAINREDVLDVLFDVGEEALGPISNSSSFFNPNADWAKYDLAKAKQTLNDNGWVTIPGLKYRVKNNQILSFELNYVDSFDRNKVANAIKQNLEQAGIELVLVPMSLDKLTKEAVTPKIFDSLLFGMNTFIDPDRYELFHSKETNNLNLASYVGLEETSIIVDKKTERIPRIDYLLQEGRSYNPVSNLQARKDAYDWVQRLIANDAPVAFLYHPKFIFYQNNRLKNVDLSNAISLERRFYTIASWTIND